MQKNIKLKTEVCKEGNRCFITYVQKNTIRAHILDLNIFLINLQHVLINSNYHIRETFTSILLCEVLALHGHTMGQFKIISVSEAIIVCKYKTTG